MKLWLEHLRAREGGEAALVDAAVGSPDASARALSETIVAPLTDRGVLRVGGPDASRFLHAQLTQDVATLTPEQSRLTAYCTPQGRAVACARLFRTDDGFLLSAPADVLGALEERLTYFRLRAQVTLENASTDLLHVGVAGENAATALDACGLSTPDPTGRVSATGPVRAVRVPGERTRVELLVPASYAPALWDTLREHAAPVGPDAWHLLEIRAGVPWVFAPTSEAFVPQMLNLHALDGVSFTKGCFPGQEVVARLRYRGALKRRTYRLLAGSGPRPLPGESVLGAGGTAAGKVAMAAAAPRGGHELLAVLLIEAAEEPSAALRLESGTELKPAPIPYDVELAYDREA